MSAGCVGVQWFEPVPGPLWCCLAGTLARARRPATLGSLRRPVRGVSWRGRMTPLNDRCVRERAILARYGPIPHDGRRTTGDDAMPKIVKRTTAKPAKSAGATPKAKAKETRRLDYRLVMDVELVNEETAETRVEPIEVAAEWASEAGTSGNLKLAGSLVRFTDDEGIEQLALVSKFEGREGKPVKHWKLLGEVVRDGSRKRVDLYGELYLVDAIADPEDGTKH